MVRAIPKETFSLVMESGSDVKYIKGKEYRNIFKEKSHEELIMLYGQFLEAEKPGYVPDNELGQIR